MTVFFTITVFFGLFLLLLEQGAKYASVAPSQYRTTGNGWDFIIVGVIGVVCAWAFS